MREYHITFTCKDEDYYFVISIVPDTEKALRSMILSQIVDIKKSNNIEECPATNLRVKYSDDDGKTWYPYAFSI